MFTLGNQFYPTPAWLVDEMLNMLPGVSVVTSVQSGRTMGSGFKYRRMLEPSAGKGDIADRVLTLFNRDWDRDGFSRKSIHAVELDEELRATLAGKGYTVVGTDFLQFDDPQIYDLILMNPPFIDGASHLLKAWDILAHGDLVCILNAETLRNPFSNEREVLADLLSDNDATIKYFDDAFGREAQRRAGVDIAVVHLHKEKAASRFEWSGFDDEDQIDVGEYSENMLARRDVIGNLVKKYQAARAAAIEVEKSFQRFKFHNAGMGVLRVIDQNYSLPDLDETLLELKEQYWNYLFGKLDLARKMTSKTRDEFARFRADQVNMAFNEANISNLLGMLLTHYDGMMANCVVEVFDKITSHHEKNKEFGRKTNRSYRVPKRFISPVGIGWDGYWKINHYGRDFFDDLERAVCYLTGEDYGALSAYRHRDERPQSEMLIAQSANVFCSKAGSQDYGKWQDSLHFTFRCYKVSTVHITFKDEDVWARFNRVAAEGKNWIGGGY